MARSTSPTSSRCRRRAARKARATRRRRSACMVALAEKMANGALAAMRDPRRAISSLLTSQEGELTVGRDPSVHKATVGAHVTTDRV
eukprot:3308340-Prymnesium_polylepis.1